MNLSHFFVFIIKKKKKLLLSLANGKSYHEMGILNLNLNVTDLENSWSFFIFAWDENLL